MPNFQKTRTPVLKPFCTVFNNAGFSWMSYEEHFNNFPPLYRNDYFKGDGGLNFITENSGIFICFHTEVINVAIFAF